MKRYIASDFHNGNDVADYDRVMAFLDLVDDDADEFLILGDWEELMWSNMTILTTVVPYKYVTQKIRDIASRKPTKIVIGNHDWNIGLFASLIEPMKIVQPFAEDGVYYTHGHQWDVWGYILGTPIDPIWWSISFPFVMPWGLGYFLLNKLLGTEVESYNKAIVVMHKLASNYALKNGYHTVVFGHSHYPVVELRDGIKLYNCGDAVDSYSYVVQTDGIIELKYY